MPRVLTDPALAKQRRLLVSVIGLTVINLTTIFSVSNLMRIRRERELQQVRASQQYMQAQQAKFRATQTSPPAASTQQPATAP